MKNSDVFKHVFGIYATELWAMGEKDFLKWLNSEHEPQPTGHWIKWGNRVKCDQCSLTNQYSKPFCPNCGARMEDNNESG